jgi:hypothetical protein
MSCLSDLLDSNKDSLTRTQLQELLPVVRRRLLDPKPSVRKPAISLLGHIAATIELQLTTSVQNTTGIGLEDLQLLQSKARDLAVSIRKQAAETLTFIISLWLDRTLPSTDSIPSVVGNIWASSVLPLTVDPESTLQEQSAKLFFKTAVTPLLKGDIALTGNEEEEIEWRSAWYLFSCVQSDVVKYFQKVIAVASKDKTITKDMVKHAEKIVNDETLRNDKSSWLLYCELLYQNPHMGKPAQLLGHYKFFTDLLEKDMHSAMANESLPRLLRTLQVVPSIEQCDAWSLVLGKIT